MMNNAANPPQRTPLGPALQRYFCQYLIGQRHLSPCTISAYRDTFKLLIGFLQCQHGIPADRLSVEDLQAPRVLAFLEDLERSRGNGARSRNARLAAIRSFIRHAASADPLLLPVAQRLLAIPVKRFDRREVGYLQADDLQAVLDAPNATTPSGQRDRVLLMLMYNTGARVSEVAGLNVGDLVLGPTAVLHLRGKGRKQRSVPLWKRTARLLRQWLKRIDPSPAAPLLPNSQDHRMTRSGIAQRLRLAAQHAAEHRPALRRLRISPHTLRHTTAMHLLQSGVDLSVIAMWLGHESIQTTHQYLVADLETQKRALACLQAPNVRRTHVPAAGSLLQFLAGL